MSADLQWECVRKFNCFIVKRDGAVFSTERGNFDEQALLQALRLLVHSRVVRVEAAANGVTISPSP